MPKYQCKNCKKIWYGWAQTTICPHCGGELKKRERLKSNKAVFVT